MDKDQVISFIKTQLNAGKITGQDLIDIVGHGSPSPVAVSAQTSLARTKPSWDIVNVLYIIGAVIVIIGVAILAYQHWEEIGLGGRLLVTLGIALIAYISGIIMGRKRDRSTLSQVMFIIAAVLAPLGTYVLLDGMAVAFDSSTQVFVALSLLIIFAVAQFAVRNNVLVIIMVALGTWAYFAALNNIFSQGFFEGDWLEWANLFLGVAYICIGYGYQKLAAHKAQISDGTEERISISNVLYGFGTLAILGAAISLGGIWDFILILLIFGAFYGSVLLKARMMLGLGALFLIAHVIKLTSKYFLDSLGWPVALIFCGVAIIAIGYGTVRLNKKYFSGTAKAS